MRITHILNTILIYTIKLIRPLLGPGNCRYSISCTQYAYIQLETLPTHKALWAIMKRVISCAPLLSYTYQEH